MARRRRTDLWDDLFDALRWLFGVIHPAWSVVVAATFFFGSIAWFRFKVERAELQVLAYYVGGVPAVVSLTAGLFAWLQRRERNRFFGQRIDLERIRALSWQAFERRVADLYRNQGFAVEETGGGGADGGVDLRLRRNGRTTLVQCKQWRVYKVGVRPVRELFGVMVADGADHAVFVSSGRYTEEALAFAKDKPMELIDGTRLAVLFADVRAEAGPFASEETQQQAMKEPEPRDPPPPLVPPGCPRCGAAMVHRTARRGANAGHQFWGCPSYPDCKGTRAIADPVPQPFTRAD
jgi:restriction system protein